MAEKTHYLPQFLLHQFRGVNLFELDIKTGKVAPRSVGNAGREIDLYPPHLEHGMFERMDNDASRIFRYKLYKRYGQDRIVINDEERKVLSEWLLLFAIRVPLNLEICESEAAKWNANQWQQFYLPRLDK